MISRHKCSGNMEVSYEDRRLPVCMDALGDVHAQNTICQELGCGQAVAVIDYIGPRSTRGLVVSQLRCFAQADSLTACNITTAESSCTLGGLRCSSTSSDSVSDTQ